MRAGGECRPLHGRVARLGLTDRRVGPGSNHVTGLDCVSDGLGVAEWVVELHKRRIGLAGCAGREHHPSFKRGMTLLVALGDGAAVVHEEHGLTPHGSHVGPARTGDHLGQRGGVTAQVVRGEDLVVVEHRTNLGVQVVEALGGVGERCHQVDGEVTRDFFVLQFHQHGDWEVTGVTLGPGLDLFEALGQEHAGGAHIEVGNVQHLGAGLHQLGRIPDGVVGVVRRNPLEDVCCRIGESAAVGVGRHVKLDLADALF